MERNSQPGGYSATVTTSKGRIKQFYIVGVLDFCVDVQILMVTPVKTDWMRSEAKTKFYSKL